MLPTGALREIHPTQLHSQLSSPWLCMGGTGWHMQMPAPRVLGDTHGCALGLVLPSSRWTPSISEAARECSQSSGLLWGQVTHWELLMGVTLLSPATHPSANPTAMTKPSCECPAVTKPIPCDLPAPCHEHVTGTCQDLSPPLLNLGCSSRTSNTPCPGTSCPRSLSSPVRMGRWHCHPAGQGGDRATTSLPGSVCVAGAAAFPFHARSL